MTDFLVLPVQEAVAWLRAWTDHSWPMTLQEAFTIRDHLGWKPAPDDGRFFTTKLATDGQEDGSIDRVDDHGVPGVDFPRGRCPRNGPRRPPSLEPPTPSTSKP